MARRTRPANDIEEREERTPEIDPQWAQQALRDAEAAFGEDGNWGIVQAEESERSEGSGNGCRAAASGLLAGLAGVAAMTVAEKVEQRITHRPNSFVPAHVLERLLRQPHKPDAERRWMNWAMHWGQGALLGAVRGMMAARGLRGPVGSFLFMNLRLLNDQTLENATRVGAPPWTWPVDEQSHRSAA